MRKVVVEAESLELLTWPTKCSRCGGGVSGETANWSEVKVGKSARVLFARATPKTLFLRLCDKCAGKIASYKRVSTIGGALVMLAIGGPIFIHYAYSQPISPETISGAAGIFWLGVIIGWIGDAKQKTVAGIKCRRQSKTACALWFRNDDFCQEFTRLNPTFIQHGK